MSIVSEINRIKNNITKSYDTIEDMKGIMPTTRNSNNLVKSIDSLRDDNYIETGYLSFLSDQSFTLQLGSSAEYNGTFESSVDSINWVAWVPTDVITSALNGDGLYALYLRGTGCTCFSGGEWNYDFPARCCLQVEGSGWLKCLGNIETLLDYQTVLGGNHPTMGGECFAAMFYGCYQLIEGPQLPALTLSSSCYRYMYDRCYNLTKAPDLPAKTLPSMCYFYMFNFCYSLKTPPKIAGETVDYMACDGMLRFTGITSLPELKFTTISGDYACAGMFDACVALFVSETEGAPYLHPWSINASGALGTDWNTSFFSRTGGTFTGNPSNGTTYYVIGKPVSYAEISSAEALTKLTAAVGGSDNIMGGYGLRLYDTRVQEPSNSCDKYHYICCVRDVNTTANEAWLYVPADGSRIVPGDEMYMWYLNDQSLINYNLIKQI